MKNHYLIKNSFKILLICGFFPIYSAFSQEPISTQMDKSSSSNNLVQTEVQNKISKRINTERKTIINDAVIAVAETRRALAELERNKPKRAMKALEKASGKLQLILARDPNLALAPVDVLVLIHDTNMILAAIKTFVDQASEALKIGEIQRARLILSGLASEVTIQTTNIPLGTYPQAIKAIALLIDKGEINQAKNFLQITLNTLVIKNHVIPLPYLRALALLDKVEKLAEINNRTAAQNQELNTLLATIRIQFELAEGLGYGKRADQTQLFERLNTISKKISQNESGIVDLKNLQQILQNIMVKNP